ncbi:MAG: 30S ribosomal protein S2, partial [Tolypothrix sp. T3-bin4]|nr:30S ribosomal protein S2 [Tolypothrix sp. T3-bin4]
YEGAMEDVDEEDIDEIDEVDSYAAENDEGSEE